MNSGLLRFCLCVMAWAFAGAASAAATADVSDADAASQAGVGNGAPYIEQIGAECVQVNVYLHHRDGVAEQVVLREPVECGGHSEDLAVADLFP
ncbi:hypothetical protein QSH18_08125 [Xanthomonas sp. NCPPB 2654]|uniref:hypothetical protein n=1 Tax=unclassified Xanthomonas TaxID=2643310 RepID=UPI0021DFEF19|nr:MULTISPECIES: hypothetical protein [unclassified Xanthomonas]MDL5365567.1 hypothetical protein [Xanthomonas sp. NCPPB 2654]MDR6673546.1 hypothetical protein [Xanthomonas translucens]UYC19097.1 hypothetical protein NUG20_12925 [Xanthomonas sp. CFBP 8443]